jgi:hypothetical protein
MITHKGMYLVNLPEVLRQRANWMPNTITARILYERMVFVMVKAPF